MTLDTIISDLAPDAQVFLRDGKPEPSEAGMLDLLGLGLLFRTAEPGVMILTDSGRAVQRELHRRKNT